jgi:DNA-binding NarL/FixJ family response regulator
MLRPHGRLRGRTIAQKLGISYKTVVNISWQLKKKLEADNLQALVRKAARLLGPTDRP